MGNTWKAVLLLAVVALLADLRVLAQENSQSPVGTWRLIVQIGDDAPTQELASFTRDGRVLNTYATFEGIPASSRWGEWRRSSGGLEFTNYTILDSNPDAGLLRARCNLNIGPSAAVMTGNCVADLIDGEGHVTATLVEFPVTAKRLPIVPID
jgi:hypothetical protein